jgi:flavin-binding protein dodecin
MARLSIETDRNARIARIFKPKPGRWATHRKRRITMSVAKVTEISCSSPTSFEDAIEKGVARADKTLDKVKGAWVSEMKVEVDDGKVTAYRVNLKVTFVLKD